ncbi:uncharacterized protein LOC141674647 [Apium graveolens]|uniref:uncharacterized protein LOC141674647 n=1 Tax=Apium graveolens TaxID=4045 RepID=UPI003D7B2BD3
MYEAKKTLTDLGLEYIKFHACPNDCVLYRGPILESSSECPKCHLSRWKVGKNGQVRVNVPAKVMWYFPIIPRFKRMFKSSSIAELMSWHANNRSKDRKMCHPSDSPSWRNVDCRWPEFGSEARNIRPQEPGNDIDVYLQSLIDDLKKLWEEGEPNVYDAHTKSFFTLKAILMWTINDFPGYGNLSGCVNKGYRACPVCDVMHVEKNGCDNIIRTLLHMKFKSKDSLASRLDLVDMGIRPDLAPEVDVSKLNKLQADVILTLCELEKIFPPSFFDVIIHLMVHLVRELRLCGPVFYRWIFPFERFNKILKSYVRNRFYPEGSIAEGYLKEESIEFCSEFYSGSSRIAGLPKDEKKISGPIGDVTMKSVAEKERDEAHLSVLRNNSEVEPYVMLHKKYLEEIYRGKKKSVQWLLGEHNRQFADWFEQKVSTEMRENAEAVSETIRWLAGKPSFSVLTYESYAVEGVRYHTKDRDNARVVQNSGVSLVARTVQVSSAKDMNPIESDLKFYGVIREIWELDYHAFKVPLFLCTWPASDKGVKSDDLGFTLVNFNRPGHKKDKYVSVDQVNQVFYIEDPVDVNWSVVLSATTRDYHDVYNEDAPEDTS